MSRRDGACGDRCDPRGRSGVRDGKLRGATLYSTLQPCGMCTMASIWSKVGRIVYGAGRDEVHRMYFEARHVDTLDFVARTYRDDLTITSASRRMTACVFTTGIGTTCLGARQV